MADAQAAHRFHEGAVIPDTWVPVVVGTNIVGQVVALRFGTGGGDAVLSWAFDGGVSTTPLPNIQDAEVFDGRVLQVKSVTGTVANILAGIAL